MRWRRGPGTRRMPTPPLTHLLRQNRHSFRRWRQMMPSRRMSLEQCATTNSDIRNLSIQHMHMVQAQLGCNRCWVGNLQLNHMVHFLQPCHQHHQRALRCWNSVGAPWVREPGPSPGLRGSGTISRLLAVHLRQRTSQCPSCSEQSWKGCKLLSLAPADLPMSEQQRTELKKAAQGNVWTISRWTINRPSSLLYAGRVSGSHNFVLCSAAGWRDLLEEFKGGAMYQLRSYVLCQRMLGNRSGRPARDDSQTFTREESHQLGWACIIYPYNSAYISGLLQEPIKPIHNDNGGATSFRYFRNYIPDLSFAELLASGERHIWEAPPKQLWPSYWRRGKWRSCAPAGKFPNQIDIYMWQLCKAM